MAVHHSNNKDLPVCLKFPKRVKQAFVRKAERKMRVNNNK